MDGCQGLMPLPSLASYSAKKPGPDENFPVVPRNSWLWNQCAFPRSSPEHWEIRACVVRRCPGDVGIAAQQTSHSLLLSDCIPFQSAPRLQGQRLVKDARDSSFLLCNVWGPQLAPLQCLEQRSTSRHLLFAPLSGVWAGLAQCWACWVVIWSTTCGLKYHGFREVGILSLFPFLPFYWLFR